MNIESNDELKEINVKNITCYYFDDINKIAVFNLDHNLIDKKSCKNILVYNISNKTLIDGKPLPIRFNKINGFIGVYDETRYFLLFGNEKYGFIYNTIR